VVVIFVYFWFSVIAFCVVTNSLFDCCNNTKRNYTKTELEKNNCQFCPPLICWLLNKVYCSYAIFNFSTTQVVIIFQLLPRPFFITWMTSVQYLWDYQTMSCIGFSKDSFTRYIIVDYGRNTALISLSYVFSCSIILVVIFYVSTYLLVPMVCLKVMDKKTHT
jgi:hypothetical protein